ncbi:MAG: lytic murein transglycosylase [Alphaproteobacteria bacterium]
MRNTFLLLLVSLFLLSGQPAFSQETEFGDAFEDWLDLTLAEAQTHGISEATTESARDVIKPIKKVIKSDRSQPEFKKTLEKYVRDAVHPARVAEGKRLLKANRRLLRSISKEYGVQPRFIVALWGIETNYGKNTGGHNLLSALATLSYEGRRAAYFKKEFMNALRIIDGGHITAKAMIGSWAGAMGQCQFMPSSFINFAVDYDRDGKKDIWGTKADIFASIANYLSRSGWKGDKTWGREVTVPSKILKNKHFLGLKKRKTLASWQKLGVRKANRKRLPSVNIRASLVKGDENKAYLVYENFRTILKWNRSTAFAVSVGTLADSFTR